MIIEGPLGDADADVLGVDMTVRFDPCEGEVCGIVLTSLDLELTDVFLGQVQFEDIEASLFRPARGVVRGEEVIFGHSSIVAEVEFGLRFLGFPLFDGARIPVLVANVGTAHGTLTPGGVFSLDEAVFQLGPQTATLTLAPSPMEVDGI